METGGNACLLFGRKPRYSQRSACVDSELTTLSIYVSGGEGKTLVSVKPHIETIVKSDFGTTRRLEDSDGDAEAEFFSALRAKLVPGKGE